MSSNIDRLIDKLKVTLYKDAADARKLLSPPEMEVRARVAACVAYRMENPLVEDFQMVQYLKSGCNGQAKPISRTQAYRDLVLIDRLTSGIQLASRQWYRYMVVEGAKKAYNLAMDAQDYKAAAACLDKIGKYTMSDKEETQADFSAMLPPSFEPSDDVTLLEGLKPIPHIEEERRRLRNLARGLPIGEDAADAQIIENNGEEEEGEEQ